MKSIKKIRVAIVAPPFGSIGGPEVVAQNLTDALLKKGIDVTLFAPKDWKTKAKLIPTLEKSLWNIKNFSKQPVRVRNNMIISSQVKILSYQKDFDIIHLHSQGYAYAVGINLSVPSVLSLHSHIGLGEFQQIKKTGVHIVSLSDSQQEKIKTEATIWNGVPVEKIKYSAKKGKYLIAIGRLTNQKGIDVAIQIAKKAGKKLLIFGRIGNSEERQEYFANKIKPFIDGKQIIYKGEVSHERIYDYLRNAEALLFTIKGSEICPMVVAESLACGTPIIGTRIKPLLEILKDKKTAFLSDDINKLVKCVKNINNFDRQACRTYAEKYFDSSVMAEKYLELYYKILKK
jgi:glycosyltransferase involved in cell wall biosynthesis